MDSPEQNEHLSEIPTLTSFVCNALDGTAESRRTACQFILERYGGAIIRYLRQSLRGSDAADELYQEWAVRLLSGRMQNFDPARGRFRDYLKTVLYHMIADHWSKQKREQQQKQLNDHEPAIDTPSMTDSEKEFVESWRANLLARTWERLAELEQTTAQPVHTVLKLRAEHSKLRSWELAEKTSAALQRPVSAVTFRQMLLRARRKFAELLIEEVRESLNQPTSEAIEEELRDLRLYQYCQTRL